MHLFNSILFYFIEQIVCHYHIPLPVNPNLNSRVKPTPKTGPKPNTNLSPTILNLTRTLARCEVSLKSIHDYLRYLVHWQTNWNTKQSCTKCDCRTAGYNASCSDGINLRLTSFRHDSNKEKNQQKSRNDAEKTGERREDFHRQLILAVVRHCAI